jgi:predicted flap endonuclease-1-like 5' DNA nuclease
MNDDVGATRRMIYLGTVDAADTIIIPHTAFAAAEQKLDAERARQKAGTEKAETEKAKRQVLQSARTGGKLRRLLGLGGD